MPTAHDPGSTAQLLTAIQDADRLRTLLAEKAAEAAKWHWAYDVERYRRESSEQLVNELLAGENPALPAELAEHRKALGLADPS